MVESYHWHLDVTFREDGNLTLEKQASYLGEKLLYQSLLYSTPRNLLKGEFYEA